MDLPSLQLPQLDDELHGGTNIATQSQVCLWPRHTSGKIIRPTSSSLKYTSAGNIAKSDLEVCQVCLQSHF